MISDSSFANYTRQIVFCDGIRQSGNKIILLRPGLLVSIQIGFHEHRTALTATDRTGSPQGTVAEFFIDLNSQLLGLLLQK